MGPKVYKNGLLVRRRVTYLSDSPADIRSKGTININLFFNFSRYT